MITLPLIHNINTLKVNRSIYGEFFFILDDLKLLISLILSPYEDLALKSMKIIQSYNSIETFTGKN